MTRYLVTFSGEAYGAQTERTIKCASGFGVDRLFIYDDVWLSKTEFCRLNHWLWDHPGDRLGNKRGVCWFAFKPYVILDALDRVSDGDIILFLDADCYPIHNLSAIYEECARIGGMMLFNVVGAQRFNYMWNKRDCFLVMGQDEPKYWYGPAGVARFMLFQKGPWRPKQFLMEWLTYCVNPLATTFDPNRLGHPNIGPAPEDEQKHIFQEHRTEQAIMTNLALKYGCKLYREACQWGEGQNQDRDIYPQLFFHDGRRVEDRHSGSVYMNVPERLD